MTTKSWGQPNPGRKNPGGDYEHEDFSEPDALPKARLESPKAPETCVNNEEHDNYEENEREQESRHQNINPQLRHRSLEHTGEF